MRISRTRARLAAGGVAALLAIPGCAPVGDTLYADLGGEPGITRFVAETVAISVADPRIEKDFDNINLDHLTRRIVLQFCQLTGGPCQYPGRDMYASHKGLHLATLDFNAFTEDLQIAMDHEGIPFPTQNRLIKILAPMYRDIVTR
jgi:hemoglobin